MKIIKQNKSIVALKYSILFPEWIDFNNQISTFNLYAPISKPVYKLSKTDTSSEDEFHGT